MRLFIFYLLYPLILTVSYCPFWLLYRVSDFLFILIYYLVGYRKGVVISNLKKSFPDYSDQQIQDISKKYYRYLCDLLLETIKTLTWKEKQVLSRVKLRNTEALDDLYARGKSFLIVMGHLGNWEWAGPGFSTQCKHQLFVVYQPLSNPYFEKMFSAARTKFNTEIIPRSKTMRSMASNRDIISATALIADQAPSPIHTALWIDFLNQETPVFTGPEKLAKMMDYAVVYMDVKRIKRGYYEVYPQVITENPNETSDNEITLKFNRILEKGIRKQPETWLWSHRRWKHKKPKPIVKEKVLSE